MGTSLRGSFWEKLKCDTRRPVPFGGWMTQFRSLWGGRWLHLFFQVSIDDTNEQITTNEWGRRQERETVVGLGKQMRCLGGMEFVISVVNTNILLSSLLSLSHPNPESHLPSRGLCSRSKEAKRRSQTPPSRHSHTILQESFESRPRTIA